MGRRGLVRLLGRDWVLGGSLGGGCVWDSLGGERGLSWWGLGLLELTWGGCGAPLGLGRSLRKGRW